MVRLGVALVLLLSASVAHAELTVKAKDHTAIIEDMAYASDGALYVTGTFFGTLTMGKKKLAPTKKGLRDGFVARIDDTGKVGWLVSTKGVSQVSALAVSAGGDIAIAGALEYIVGKEDGPATDWRARGTVLVLGSDGKRRYQIELPTQDRSWVSDIAFASDGTVVACGGYASKTTFGGRDVDSTMGPYVPSVDGFTMHLTADGAVDWLATGGGAEDDRATSIAVTPTGDIVVAGEIGPAAKFGSQKLSGPPSYAQAGRLGNPSWAYVAGYTAQGMLRFASQYQGHDSTRAQADALVATADGSVLYLFEDMELVSGNWKTDHVLLHALPDGTMTSRTLDELGVVTPDPQGLVTARLGINDLVLDAHDGKTSTPLSSIRRDPERDLELLSLARAPNGRYALATTVSALDPTITFGTTATELLPKLAK